MDGWPAGSAFTLWRVRASAHTVLAEAGDLDESRRWASVSKFAVATGMARMHHEGLIDPYMSAGPPTSTLAHLLSHASGLGFEAGDPVRAVGERRIYSNVGIDTAVDTVRGDELADEWLDRWTFAPLGLATRLVDRPAFGARGSVTDMAQLGAAWLDGGVGASSAALFAKSFLPDLDGVVPGFGRFSPCPWGLGAEVHGAKGHWMGTKLSAASFGHFGRSGALVAVDPERSLVLAGCAGADFGGWAVRVWPRWVDDLFARFVL
jgi:CubicO group peptidase (beta-lactamase class C family)